MNEQRERVIVDDCYRKSSEWNLFILVCSDGHFQISTEKQNLSWKNVCGYQAAQQQQTSETDHAKIQKR